MLRIEELNNIFGQLTQTAESCLSISEFREISEKYVREALEIHKALIKNNSDFFLKLLLEIVDLLELSMPTDIPYVPFVNLNINKNKQRHIKYKIIFRRKDSRVAIIAQQMEN